MLGENAYKFLDLPNEFYEVRTFSLNGENKKSIILFKILTIQ